MKKMKQIYLIAQKMVRSKWLFRNKFGFAGGKKTENIFVKLKNATFRISNQWNGICIFQ